MMWNESQQINFQDNFCTNVGTLVKEDLHKKEKNKTVFYLDEDLLSTGTYLHLLDRVHMTSHLTCSCQCS